MRKYIIFFIGFTFLFSVNCGYDKNFGYTVRIFYESGCENPRWSDYDNRIYFVPPWISEYSHGDIICSIDENGDDLKIIDFGDKFCGEIGSFSISPDGKFIVFSGNEISNELSLIYKYSFETGTVEELFNNDDFVSNGCPVWNADDWIYFIRDNGGMGDSQIWRIRPDGSELSKVDVDINKDIFSIDNSKDGKYLLLGCYGGYFNEDIIILSLDDLNIRKIDNDDNFYNPCFSPDSRWICAGHDHELYIMSSQGDFDPVRITDHDEGPSQGDIEPYWSPDGEWIVFLRDYGFLCKVKVPDEFLP